MKRRGPVAVEIEAKLARHRKWSWCRHWNGFCDLPIWRMVAEELGLPVYQVVAFASRLEELANAAEPRGYVGEFRPGDFAAALGMSRDDARRIFEVLRSVDAGWIDGQHVASFHSRNPDREDLDAAQRQRKRRWRIEITDRLDRLFAAQKVTEVALWQVKALLPDLDHDTLEALVMHLRKGNDLTGVTLSTGRLAITSQRDAQSAVMSRCDSVTVTPRADLSLSSPAVDKSGDAAPPPPSAAASARGDAEKPPKTDAACAGESSTSERDAARQWLNSEGARIVTERMTVPPPRAALLIERWQRDLDEPMALVDIILGADNAELTGGRFHVSVTDQIGRYRRAREQGAPLNLGPVPLASAATKPTAPASAAPAPDLAQPLRKIAG